MRLQIATFLLSLTTAACTERSRPIGLSMTEFNSILMTDINEEFAVDDDADTTNPLTTTTPESLWMEATEREWNRAEEQIIKTNQLRHDDEEASSSSSSFPYIVCDMTPSTSGFASRHAISSHFKTHHLYPLYNSQDKTCFLTTLTPSVASLPTTFHEFRVQPLLPETKIAKGVVDAVLLPEEDGGRPWYNFEVMLCPGVVDKDEGVEKAEERARKIGSILRQSFEKSEKDSTTTTTPLLMKRLLQSETTTTHNNPRETLWSNALQNGFHDPSSPCTTDLFNHLFITPGYKGQSLIFGTSLDGRELSKPHRPLTPWCTLSLLKHLSSRREICHVGGLGALELMNAPSQWILQSGGGVDGEKEGETPWFDVGLDGTGQVVAMSDSGIDMNNCYFWDSDGNVVRNGEEDSSKRKVIQYVPHMGFNDDKAIGHGTHVAGTIAGRRARYGSTESTGVADGMAREAKLSMIDIGIFVALILPPFNIKNLFEPGQESGAQIHSASWGSPSDNSYNIMAKSFDAFMYDNPEFLIVLAAGNTGANTKVDPPIFDIPYTVGAPATAKNVLSVGATESWGDELNEPKMKGYPYVAYFSSRGPTADNRTKPDILAPGYNILSAKSYGRSTVHACDNTDGTKYMAGTSMSTPAVSGVAALVRQYFTEGYYPSGMKNKGDELIPTSALVKAVLMNGGSVLKGVNNFGEVSDSEVYDDAQNFGRVNLYDSLRLINEEGMSSDIDVFVKDRVAIGDGMTEKVTVTAASTERCSGRIATLSVTLVWNDVPAGVPGCAKCLMNDLDLVVIKKSSNAAAPLTFSPNGGDGKDDMNNAERVQVDDGVDGDEYVISVVGSNLVTQMQDYALVVTGCFNVVDE